MGQVYRATDLALGRRCAVKILPPEFPGHLRDRLLLEARTAARLQHPGIATFFEVRRGRRTSLYFHGTGRGNDVAASTATWPVAAGSGVVANCLLLGGLGHAHAVGILHRDIKPENIMLVGERAIKLLDFGLAKEFVQQQTDDRTISMLTEQGAVVGTIGYMSPEQLRGEKLDERADLFSVGAVLYESISGKPAFPGQDAYGTNCQHPDENSRPAGWLRRDVANQHRFAKITGQGSPTTIFVSWRIHDRLDPFGVRGIKSEIAQFRSCHGF